MRKSISFILSLLCVGAFTAATVTAEEAAGGKMATEKPAGEMKSGDMKAMPAAKKGKLTSIKGEVTEVDPAGNNLKIKDKDKEVTMNVTDKTVITAGKIKKSLADLKAGDKVVAKATEEDGKMVARSIRMASAGKASTTGKK
ncbi:MAG: hypothetical protein HY282_03675 [Nitrospirae bacterium]|nr:hypothetical protein [Candidatus Manganitrophaceae bacterium]